MRPMCCRAGRGRQYVATQCAYLDAGVLHSSVTELLPAPMNLFSKLLLSNRRSDATAFLAAVSSSGRATPPPRTPPVEAHFRRRFAGKVVSRWMTT